jgi:hypothetical protein
MFTCNNVILSKQHMQKLKQGLDSMGIIPKKKQENN